MQTIFAFKFEKKSQFFSLNTKQPETSVFSFPLKTQTTLWFKVQTALRFKVLRKHRCKIFLEPELIWRQIYGMALKEFRLGPNLTNVLYIRYSRTLSEKWKKWKSESEKWKIWKWKMKTYHKIFHLLLLFFFSFFSFLRSSHLFRSKRACLVCVKRYSSKK